jgi:hypothetical protein
MEQSPSWKANSGSYSQKIKQNFMETEGILQFHKSLHRAPSWARWIQSTSTHPIPPSGFPTKFYMHFSSLSCVVHSPFIPSSVI